MARPRKATELKALQGTLQKCRTNMFEPIGDTSYPVCPETLTGISREHFELLAMRLDNENRAFASHTEIIALAATVYYRTFGEAFNNNSAQLYLRCLTALCLTPESKSKAMASKKDPIVINKFAV